MLFATPPAGAKLGVPLVRLQAQLLGRPPALPLAAAGRRWLRLWSQAGSPEAARRAGARSGGFRMAVPGGGGEGQSGQLNPAATPDARPETPSVSVGIPVPVEVWDQLLHVWRVSKNKSGRDQMNSRTPLMAISFPLELDGQPAGMDAKELVDEAVERAAERLSDIKPFRLSLGKFECVPDVDGGWSVVVCVAESQELARLREQVLLLFPQSGNAALFATPSESGFVARLPLATYRSRNEAYAALEQLTAVYDPSSAEAAGANATVGSLDSGEAASISWGVSMAVMAEVPSGTSGGGAASDYYRVMALGGVDEDQCAADYQRLASALAAPARGARRGKGSKGVRPPNKDELRVLRQVMGDFDADFEADKEVSVTRRTLFALISALRCA
jgi:hypothetical protein